MVAIRYGIRRLTPLALLLATAVAHGGTIVVSPGPGAPLQTAIDQSNPGDTIRLDAGVFAEAIVVSKPLRIIGAFQGGPRDRTQPNLSTIDAVCGAPYAIEVAADHVRLERLNVRRGSEGGVRMMGRDRVEVWDVRPSAVQSDPELSCGTERYGINVSGGGKIKIAGGAVRGDVKGSPTGLGFLTAGIRLANVISSGRVDVRDYTSTGNQIGVLVENSAGAGIKLKGLLISAIETGILLQDADVVTVRSNTINAANGLSPESGIALDADSTGNRLSGNEITGAENDILDEGWANCWRHNVYITGQLPLFNCL